MPSLGVPEHYRIPIRRLGSLNTEQIDRLLGALGPERHLGDAAALRAVFEESLAEPDTDAMAFALLSMSTVREGGEVPAEEFADELSRAEELEIADEQRADFKAAIARLLANSTVQAVARSMDVQTEHQRVFLESRILTDLRPVFTGDETQLLGMVMVHSLKILYSEHGQTKSFYVALDSRDTEQLRSTLERASDKSSALEESLSTAEITHLRPEER